ncbi:hypothetical protein ACFFX0_25845 [Citricoccus parietis]|uniref:Uncharacterized protein n=1 Tax=Citricoccus parietis TaxID=592307 RepID=A0ABV5G644_9MICC
MPFVGAEISALVEGLFVLCCVQVGPRGPVGGFLPDHGQVLGSAGDVHRDPGLARGRGGVRQEH